MKLLNKTKTEWCAELAYAIGLIATDGNLSKDGRHINFTSKDKQLAGLFAKCLNLQTKITMKGNGFGKEKKYYFVQFGDKNFYRFLEKLVEEFQEIYQVIWRKLHLTYPLRFYHTRITILFVSMVKVCLTLVFIIICCLLNNFFSNDI